MRFDDHYDLDALAHDAAVAYAQADYLRGVLAEAGAFFTAEAVFDAVLDRDLDRTEVRHLAGEFGELTAAVRRVVVDEFRAPPVRRGSLRCSGYGGYVSFRAAS